MLKMSKASINPVFFLTHPVFLKYSQFFPRKKPEIIFLIKVFFSERSGGLTSADIEKEEAFKKKSQ